MTCRTMPNLEDIDQALNMYVKNETVEIKDEYDQILDGIDILFTIETFYNWEIIELARERGIKTVLLTMFEMTPSKLDYVPDLFICPSKLDYEKIPEPKVFIPIPVATDRLEWQLRSGKPKIFVHSASHLGIDNRKGTYLLLQAMKYVRADIQLWIYSWRNLLIDAPKTELKLLNFENYWQIWREGDVLVYPQDYNGICLPIIEAMSSGLGVITTDIFPFNEYMPKELLFSPSGFRKVSAQRGCISTEGAIIEPKVFAKKIDAVAQMDITPFSEYGREWAEENSWEVLLDKYKKVIYEM